MVRGEASISAAISCAVTGRRLRRNTWIIRKSLSARLMIRPCRHAADTMLSAAWQYEKSLLTREISMLTFYGFGPAFGLPDPSPFVMKSEVHLKMAGVPYNFQRSAPQSAPKGKNPYIQVGAHRVGDSTFIRAHIEKTTGFDFDKGLYTVQRSIAWAFERMLEDHLYFALIQMRWLDDENWQKGPIHFFDGAPDGVAEATREKVREKLVHHGIGRHSVDEIAELGGRSLDALSAF